MKRWILLIILCLATIVRCYRIAEVPEGFHADEASFGYNAYSILKTGRDENGEFLPSVLRSFGDQKGAVYSYITIPFIAVFGLNEFAVRLPTALTSITLIITIFLLVRLLSGDETLSLLSATITAISPTSITLSRVQSDPLVAFMFIYAGMYFLFVWKRYKRITYLTLAIALLILSVFTYQIAKVIAPVYLLITAIVYRKELPKNGKRTIILSFMIILMIIVYLTIFYGERFRQISPFTAPEIPLMTTTGILEDGVMRVPVVVARVFHNKVISCIQFFLQKYFQYFDPTFLFLQSSQPLRERIPNTGFLYLADLPFILFGTYHIIKKKLKWGKLLILWFLIGTAFFSPATNETPNIHRYFITLIPVYIVIAYGIQNVINKTARQHRYIAVIITTGIYLVSFLFYLHNLFVHQPVFEPYYRDAAYKPLIETLTQIRHKYSLIVFTKERSNVYIHWLFYTKYDPSKYQQEGSPLDEEYTQWDGLYFVPGGCPSEDNQFYPLKTTASKPILFVNIGGCKLGLNSRSITTIPWHNGLNAFELVEYISTGSAKIPLTN